MTVFMTNTRNESASQVVGPERRRRWSLKDKLQMVRESYKPGSSVSMVARRHAVSGEAETQGSQASSTEFR